MARPNNDEMLFDVHSMCIHNEVLKTARPRKGELHDASTFKFASFYLHLLLKILTNLDAALVTIFAQTDGIRIARAIRLFPTNFVAAHWWYERGESEGG